MTQQHNNYTPSPQYQTLLDKYGIDLYSPNLKLAHNTDAEKIIPRSTLSKWLHKLFSLFMMMIFISLLMLPETLYASHGSEMEAIGLTHSLVVITSFLALIFTLLVAIYFAIQRAADTCLTSIKSKEQKASKQKSKSKINIENSLTVSVGGATRKGLIREENQDAFEVTKTSDDYGLLIVCDGVGGHPGGREASQFAANFLKLCISCRLKHETPSAAELQAAIQATQRAFVTHELIGMSTVIVALVVSNTVYYATMGDGDLVIIHPDGMTQSLLAPHHALGQPDNIITAHLSSQGAFTARTGAIQLESESLILAMTDGVSELLDIEQIATHRQAYIASCHEQGINSASNQIVKGIEAARDEETDALLHSDNMTLAIALVSKELSYEAC